MLSQNCLCAGCICVHPTENWNIFGKLPLTITLCVRVNVSVQLCMWVGVCVTAWNAYKSIHPASLTVGVILSSCQAGFPGKQRSMCHTVQVFWNAHHQPTSRRWLSGIRTPDYLEESFLKCSPLLLKQITRALDKNTTTDYTVAPVNGSNT